MQDSLQEISQLLRQFTRERQWDQFHNPKDLAIALSIEASELLEVFLWKKPEEISPDRIKEELADVFTYALLLAAKCGLDVPIIVKDKMAANAIKYPIDKSKGSAKKYNEL